MFRCYENNKCIMHYLSIKFEFQLLYYDENSITYLTLRQVLILEMINLAIKITIQGLLYKDIVLQI